jgi:hypothetical protein
MANTIDWTDTTLRSLDELARTAFPESAGVTAQTLKLRIRQGKLIAYRPGKAYLSSYAQICAMMDRVKVQKEPNPAEHWRPEPPDPFGRTRAQVAQERVLHALDQLKEKHKANKEEERRQRQLERARTEPERRRQRLEARRAKARERYREKRAATAAAEPGHDTSQK